jgi:hypothetical protein
MSLYFLFFNHIYEEMNAMLDGLSKDGVQMAYGQWYILEDRDELTSKYYHPPFNEAAQI